MTDLLRAAGGLCLLVVLVGIVLLVASRGVNLLQVQLGTDARRVKELIDVERFRRLARRALMLDFGFIAAYTAAFVALAVVIARRDGGWVALGVAAVLAATATAALDVLENLRTLEVLSHGGRPEKLPQALLDRLRRAALAKWAASATTVALLAGVFIQSGWPLALAVILLVIAALGFAGLRRPRLIRCFFGALSAVTLGLAGLLLLSPESIARGL